LTNCSPASDGRGWYLTDHLGTVRDIADAAGAVVTHVDYSSFGQVIGVSNPGAVDRFLFTGREYDDQVGMYFYRARYVDTQLGRFVSQDPAGFGADEMNVYRYVGNHPIDAMDPNGQTSVMFYVSLTLTITLVIPAASCFVKTDNKTLQGLAEAVCPVSLTIELVGKMMRGLEPVFGPFDLPYWFD
jgi:RHS repeat-associated protein